MTGLHLETMFFLSSVAILLAALAGLVTAENTTHIVYVAANGFNFSPSELTAEIGDIIEFQFFPPNHSIVRASFGFPCIPYEFSANKTGFFSGFFPVTLTVDPPTWSVTVNDTEPIFYYCGAPGSCQQGMVGVINPNSTFTFEKQLAYAENTTIAFVPGEPYPTEGEISSITRITTASGSFVTPTALVSISASTTTTPTSVAPITSSTSASVSQQTHSSLTTGAIIGIAVTGLIVALLVGVVFYMCGRQRTVTDLLRQQMAPNNTHQPSYGPPSPEFYYGNTNMPKPSGQGNGRFSGTTYNGPVGLNDTESYRSRSPPVDERTAMRASILGVSIPSPTSIGPGYPSPMHYDAQGQENTYVNASFRAYHQYESPGGPPSGSNLRGPHEMATMHNESAEDRENRESGIWTESVKG